MRIISKSKFVSGIQCEKKLFFDVHRKDLKPELSEQQIQLFQKGHEIGSLAQSLFSGGLDASQDINGDWSLAIERTKEYVKRGIKTIYEATFSNSGAFAALDILHRQQNELWAIEVKSSADLKEYHLTDAALQYWVMNKCGVAPNKFFLMHINSAFVKDGAIKPEQLFTMQDITHEVISKQNWVEHELSRLNAVINNLEEPEKPIGKHCHNPFKCDYMHHCWKHISKNSVFELYSPRGKDWDLYGRGILKIEDIPESEMLNKRQQMQAEGIKFNREFIDKAGIQDFFSNWKFPLYFFDFETIFPAVPQINGSRPFQQTPFQYSLHIVNSTNEPILHKEFLAQANHFSEDSFVDPRELLLKKMQKDIGSEGSIVAYNATFEMSVLKSLLAIFPEYSSLIDNWCHRFVDLWTPFRQGMFYLPQMGKSASIKAVLPALAPELSYDDLIIRNGGDASDTFMAMIKGNYLGDEETGRKQLLQYCERDTYGMLVIWEKLMHIIA